MFGRTSEIRYFVAPLFTNLVPVVIVLQHWSLSRPEFIACLTLFYF